MVDKNSFRDVFAVLSNEVRRDVLVYLRENKMATFSELMKACNLDIMWDCGTLGYHLNLLVGEGIIKKSSERYKLTDFGLHIADLLENIEKMEVKKEMVQRTIMTFGNGSSIGLDCGGIIAKHVKRGDKAYAVVEWDTPPGARRTDMMEAAKNYFGFTDIVCLTDYAPELKGIGNTVPFLEHTLVPLLIKVLQKPCDHSRTARLDGVMRAIVIGLILLWEME